MHLYSAPKLRGLYLLSNVNMTAQRSNDTLVSAPIRSSECGFKTRKWVVHSLATYSASTENAEGSRPVLNLPVEGTV